MKNNKFFKYSGLGIEFATTILLFVFFGVFLDKKLNTLPLFTLLLTLVGFSSAVYLMYKTFKQMEKLDKDDDD